MSSFRQLSLAGMLVLAACSGGGESSTVDTVVQPASTTTTSVVADDAAAAGGAGESGATVAEESTDWTVAVEVRTSGFEGEPVDATVVWSGDPASSLVDGPFGEFGACSGLRARVGAYSVVVSGGDDLDAVSVWSADRVAMPGIYDAEVRIERAGAAPISASGTMTIVDGLQQGEFLAFSPSGGRVEGTFSCLGTAPPTPLPTDGLAANGELDAVEVFALLRDGEAERVLGLAADVSSGAECPAADGTTSPVVVRVDGDEALGGLTTFELTAAPSITARLSAGGRSYEFVEVVLSLEEGGSSGVFSGVTVDGVSVDGAFRCT